MSDSLITIGVLLTASGIIMLFAAKAVGDKNWFLSYSLGKELAAYKNKIEGIIAQENARLRSLGIKPPRLISELVYRQTKIDKNHLTVELIPPQFELPTHRAFVINEYKGPVITLFENLDAANHAYRWWGLGDAVKRADGAVKKTYGGVWTNREPYAVYRKLQIKPEGTISYRKRGDFSSAVEDKTGWNRRSLHQEAGSLPPLEAVPGLSSEEASDVHLRVQLFNYATDYYHRELHDPQNYYALEHYGASRLPEDITFKLPVPCTWLPVDYSCLKIIPSGTTRPAQMVEFLSSLRDINQFFSFELVKAGETVYFRFEFPTVVRKQIVSKLNLYFPDFKLIEDNPCFPPMPYTIKWIKKASLYNSITRLRDMQIDPFAHFAAIFDTAAAGEFLCYQIVFAPLLDKAAAVIKRHLENYPPYSDQNYAKQFAKKLPLWFVSINASGSSEQTAGQVIETLARTLDTPEGNFSKPYSYALSEYHFPQKFPAFTSMFDTEELAALAHFPVTELPLERLEKLSMKNVRPPQLYTTGDVRIGQTKARGQTLPVTLPEEVRDRHVYIVGKSGTGKSTLIETIARRDIEAGRGLAVIDPHGDLVQHLLEVIPECRVDDCILFSPKHSPFSLEILTAENEHEIDLLSDDLITMFRRTSESWGDKMQAILQMAFQTLLRVPGSSFTDITPFLTDEGFRNRILGKIDHPQLANFWQQRYDARQAEPILIRMDRLTTSGTLRQVLTQNRNSLNFYDVITESKIFLADLSKGFLGESTSHLLGSIIVSQIQLAAMRQAHLPAEQRVPFSLFVDEVQNFTTSAFTTILSEARKQKLRLTIAHQFVSQLPQEIQKAVFGNVGTLVFFAMSPDDLGAARHELGQFEPADVANLPKYHALCRPATAARDTFSFATDPPPPVPSRSFTQAIIENTRREYGTLMEIERQPLPVQTQQDWLQQEQSPQINLPSVDRRRPAQARPLNFATNTEKILHFIRLAEYLSQPQIIALTGLQPPNASTALKKLVDTGQIKSLDDRRPKIYFIGRTCNATTHNLLIRDLLVKIYASGFAVSAVKFNEQLSEINPDLTVEFTADDTTPLLCYFELDRGTEGAAELARKADRYARLSDNPKVCFVFERESDMQLARARINYPFISYAVLDQFTSLRDEAFYPPGASPTLTTFFGS